MTKPLVSINCITYNHASYIRRCLDSFLMQKGDFLIEILIHDDASTDGTADIIREYEQNYPEIIKPIYQTENQWSKDISKVLYYNFLRMNGKYLATCEGDDYWIDDSFLKDGIMFLEESDEYNCYATNTIYKSKNSENTVLDVQNKQYDKVGHNISFDNYLYLHTSARIYRNIFSFPNFEKLFNHPSYNKGEIYCWYTFLDIGKVYFAHKVTSVYNITGVGEWTKLSDKEQERRMFKVCINGNKLLNNKYYNFFWEIIPKNRYMNTIVKIIGTEKLMKLLTFLFSKKN